MEMPVDFDGGGEGGLAVAVYEYEYVQYPRRFDATLCSGLGKATFHLSFSRPGNDTIVLVEYRCSL